LLKDTEIVKDKIFVKTIIFLFTLLPLLLLISFSLRYTVNIPFSDDWYFIPLFEKMFNHTLTFKDLWAQHNEHRFLITKLITLTNVWLTGWDLKYEIYLNVALGIAIFLALLTLLRREAANFSKFSAYWILPTLSFLIFSLTQSRNWLWGIQMNIFLNMLFVVLGFVELTSTLNWKSILFASFLGLLATYSNASGLLYWPVALIIIYLNPHVLKKTKHKMVTFWWATSAIIIVSYFYNWLPPQYGFPSVGEPIPTLLRFAELSLGLSGSALEIVSSKIAIAFGFLGITIYVYLILMLKKTKLLKSPLFLSQLALSLYAIFNIATVSFGRLKFNLPQEQLATRYGLTSTLFWVSITILTFYYANLRTKKLKQKFKLSLNQVTLSFIIIAIVSTLVVKSSFQGIQLGIKRQNFLKSIQKEVISNKSPNETLLALTKVYPLQNYGNLNNVVRLADLINAINILSKHNLSIFK